MSAPFAAIDAATVAALKGGDEKALEKIFRSHYDVLLERAVERLKGEPAAAPRLVASTVLELWAVRGSMETSAQVEGFFNEELRNRAGAVRARMASVHRFEKKEGVAAHDPRPAPSADELWKEIAETLHRPPVDPAEAAKRRRANAAHGAAEHIAKVSARRSWKGPALIATLGAIAVVVGVMYANKAGKAAAVSQLLASNDAQTVLTRQGQFGNLPLSDSSTVRLAAESRITVIPKFGVEYRAASVMGSAAVTVAPGNPMPLEIRLGDASAKASSGEFAVRDYPDDGARFVNARTATVEVTAKGGTRTLNPGETIAIDSAGMIRDATATEAAQYFAWVDGKLVLRDVTVAYAAQRLWRWFGMEVTVADSAARDRLISISVPLESSKAAVEAIGGAGGVVFGYDKDNKMIFSAPAPTRARRAR
ncbi:MAG: FecR domain-containing protein [Gemmatimonadales bacterium]|nr:FecR domain-containing protein [Gemmatimonadales bacterium]